MKNKKKSDNFYNPFTPMYLRTKQKVFTDEKSPRKLIDMYLSNSKLAATTKHTRLSFFNVFCEAMPDNIEYITGEHIEEFLMVHNKNLAVATKNEYVKYLKSFYAWPTTTGHDFGFVFELQPQLPTDQRLLTREEYNRVCQTASGNSLDVFRFLCATGLRLKEFIHLTPENVSRGGFLRVITAKTKKPRSIPLNRTAKEILTRSPEFSFIAYRTNGWVQKTCRRLSRDAGIPKFHPHSCRHYFATELYYKGVPMPTISKVLGHTSTAITETVYVHWPERKLEGVTDILD